MSKIWNSPWLNQNSQRNYPLSEEASTLDVSGSFRLPLDLIVDFVWPVQATANVQTDKFHVKSVGIFGSGVAITFGYYDEDEGESVTVGSVSVSADTHERNQSYFIAGLGDFYDSVGKVTIGSLDNVLASGGSYTFDVDGARLEPTTVRPALKGVSALVMVNGTDRSDPLYGDVEMTAGQNIRLTVFEPEGDENPRIRIDAVADDDFTEDCDCTNLTSDSPPIRSINGVSPDPITGNIDLVSLDECLVVENDSTNFAVKLTDQCSESCCGCTELEQVINDLNLLNLQISTLNGVATDLRAQITTATLNLLASKTTGGPCEE